MLGTSKIGCIQLADHYTLNAGQSVDLPVNGLILKGFHYLGYWSLEIKHETGSNGTITAKPVCSNSGENYRVPSDAIDICTNFSNTDGEQGDGVDLFPIDLGIVTGYLKIRFTESSGANPVTFSAWLCYAEGK